jgi:RNA polymerase sigma-70 factor, ECF subfamily
VSSEAALQLPEALIEATGGPETRCQPVEPFVPETVDQSIELLSDEHLLEAVGQGDKQALGILFQRHGRAVLNVAWRILRDGPEAQDLRQEVFLYLFERAKLYDARKASASSWIIQITYHRAFDRRRFLNFRHHYKIECLDDQRVGASVAKLSTDKLDAKAILEKLGDQLSSEQRRTLELHFFEGYSFSEIAEQSGQTIGNVRHHFYRALERLRSNLFSKKRS